MAEPATNLRTSNLDIPLESLNSATPDPTEVDTETTSSSQPINAIDILPPVDTGRDAYLFLLGATMIEVLVWGLPSSVGILHDYWTKELFPGGKGESVVTIAATLQTGMMYMLAVVFIPVFSNYPRLRLHLQLFGLFAGSIGLVVSGFVTSPWQLIVTLGIIYPMSAALYLPAVTLLFEWFQIRRGSASGIMFAGTGVGGTIFPFVMSGLLDKFGYKAAMVSLGLGFGLVGGASLALVKPRIPLPRSLPQSRHRNSDLTSSVTSIDVTIGSPPAPSRVHSRKIDWSFLKRSTFYAFTATVMLTSLGNFIPSVWIPTFTTDVGITSISGTSLIALMNASSIPGMALLGYLTDHIPIRSVILLSCVASSLSCLFLWGIGGTSEVGLVLFVLVFGAMGPSFSAVWTKLISIIAKDDTSLPPTIFSIFAFSRGIGNITSGPVADALLRTSGLRGKVGGYGVGNFGPLLIYTSLTMLLGASAGVGFSTVDQ